MNPLFDSNSQGDDPPPSVLSLQEHVINISRTVAVPQIAISQTEVPQIEVHIGESSVQGEEVELTEKQPSDQPRILYQCGDCDELFKSLEQWQHHRKEGGCQRADSPSKSKPDSHDEPETTSALSEITPSNPDDSAFSQNENSGNLEPEPEAKAVEHIENEDVPQTTSSQSSEAHVAQVAASASNQDDSSPRRRGANKKPKPEPVLLCVDCGSCFGLVSELVAHRKTQHGFEEALHRCSVCGESFLNTTLFLYHRKQHRQKGEEKVVEVYIQSNGADEQDATSSTASLNATFTQPELFFCTLCGQSFNNDQGLVTHRKEKHGLTEPLHSCSYCGESFMNTTQYMYHRRLHSFTTVVDVAEEAEAADETVTPEGSPQSTKRLLSSPASAGDSGSPLPKRSKPSFRILSASALKGK